MGRIVAAVCLLCITLAGQPLPWIYPGDIRERLRISDLVISGTIEGSSRIGVQVLDRTKVTANVSGVRVDRVFRGWAAKELKFRWFSQYTSPGVGSLYSGPPLAEFRPDNRYLIFLSQKASGWEVAMPLYALEVKLASQKPQGALPDLTGAPPQEVYQALAEEMETAALLVAPPPPGVTGEAATYFPAVFNLLEGCAEPFYRRFLTSSSGELRAAALNWLSLIRSRSLTCSGVSLPRVPPWRTVFADSAGGLDEWLLGTRRDVRRSLPDLRMPALH